jgi:uncharacterized alkaline shock family protein YloU
MEKPINTIGSIKIYDEVLAVIAALAAREIRGVHSSSHFLQSINDMIGRKNPSKGVKIVVTNETVAVEIQLAVEYGTPIPQLAWDVQENVKKSIEGMAGLQVSTVDVLIQAVKFVEASNGFDDKN